MAGEKQAVRKICNTQRAEERERRRKQRAEAPPTVVPQPPQEPTHEPIQVEEEVEEQGIPPPPSPVARMATRAIAMGRRVDFGFFEDYHFSIGIWIERMGWRSFCNLNIPMYPKLVREFYENLKRDVYDIVSTVKGVEIRVSEESLAQIFGITTEGFVPEKLSDKKRGLRLIVGRDDIVGDVLAPTLSVEMRVLHHIIGGIFIPKLGRHDFVSERELCMMYLMVQGTQINLPGIMMHQMKEAASRNKVCLPYGMALTRVFETAGVSFENEGSKKLSHFDVYDMRALTRMQYHVEDGRWVKNVSGQERRVPRVAGAGEPSIPAAPRDIPDPGSPATPRAPPAADRSQQAPPPDSDTWERLADMISGRVSGDIQGLTERVVSLQTQMTSISERLAALEERHQTPADLSGITQEVARLRGRVESESMEIMTAIRGFGQAQQQGIISVLGAMGSLIGKIEGLAPGAIPAAAAADAAARAAMPRPPPPPPMSPVQTQASTSTSRPPLRVYTRGGRTATQPAGPSARTRSRRGRPSTRASSSHTLEITSDDDASH